MARIDNETVRRWEGLAREWLRANTGLEPMSIRTGIDAWTVAQCCGIIREAYVDPTVVDAHIQTALEKIFPNAQFRDAKRY